MEILGLLRELGDFAAIFYAAVCSIALGLFFWDRQPVTADQRDAVEAREQSAASHAIPDSVTLHTPA